MKELPPVKYLNTSLLKQEGDYIIFQYYERAAEDVHISPDDPDALTAYDFMNKLYHAPTPGMSVDDADL